jgi:hypothetical protein
MERRRHLCRRADYGLPNRSYEITLSVSTRWTLASLFHGYVFARSSVGLRDLCDFARLDRFMLAQSECKRYKFEA